MRFHVYDHEKSFGADVLDMLLEHEAQNNLLIDYIRNERGLDSSKWLMASVKDDGGDVLLAALYAPPFPIVLYERGNCPTDAAVERLSHELKAMNHDFPGVFAQQALAHRFASAYAGEGNYRSTALNHVMRLDQLAKIPEVLGRFRAIEVGDLHFLPYWNRAMEADCGMPPCDILEESRRLASLIGKDTHFIWENANGQPVAQAAHGRSTQSGASIKHVYTPPHFRNNGYATAVVAALSGALLMRGYRFCCLFADAENPASCDIYHKVGYINQCIFEELVWERGDIL